MPPKAGVTSITTPTTTHTTSTTKLVILTTTLTTVGEVPTTNLVTPTSDAAMVITYTISILILRLTFAHI